MTKPPKSTPHSDIDGVHEDEKPNVESAAEAGQTTANLGLARELSKGKPPHVGEESGESPR